MKECKTVELAKYAEQILFGSLLDDKLCSPAVLTDEKPAGQAILDKCVLGGSLQPGRPHNLLMSESKSSAVAAFPKHSELDVDAKRGEVLHFFANHELLALELMALVLLRFPNAPKAFRRGLAQTMRDEQKHMRLYIKHMDRLGIQFGDLSVGGYFWRMLSQIQSPYEFVTQMGLTFEQANLDFALFYSRVFSEMGDSESAAVMDEVYIDEIRHVRHGFQWFNHWKPKDLSEWEAYSKSMVFPLSPMRAKGTIFSFEARREIGFSDDYIHRLARFNQSKGRPPRIYLYNPAQELEVGYGSLAFTQSSVVQEIACDLEFMMCLVAAPDDVLALRSLPSSSMVRHLEEARIPIQEVALFHEKKNAVEWKSGRKNAGLVPWGESPKTMALNQKLLKAAAESSNENENPAARSLSKAALNSLVSKSFAAKIQNELSMGFVESDVQDRFHPGKVVTTFEETISAIESSLSSDALCTKRKLVVIKACFGASGRNMLRVESCVLTTQQSHWIKKNLSLFGELIVEPWREVLAEFSFQSSVNAQSDKVVHHGMVRNVSSKNGQYLASCAGKMMFELPVELRRFLFQEKYGDHLQKVAQVVGTELAKRGYEGAFGVDSYIFKDKNGKLKIQSIGEVNLRHTMGRLALEAKRFCQAGKSVFLLMPQKHLIQESRFPKPKLMSSGDKELVESGCVFLGDVERAKRVVPCVWVTKESEAKAVLDSLDA